MMKEEGGGRMKEDGCKRSASWGGKQGRRGFGTWKTRDCGRSVGQELCPPPPIPWQYAYFFSQWALCVVRHQIPITRFLLNSGDSTGFG